MTRPTLVVVGDGMVGHRFVEAAVRARATGPVATSLVLARGARAGLRPGRADVLLLRSGPGGPGAATRRDVRRPAGAPAARRAGHRDRPRGPHGRHSDRAPGRLRRAGAGHRLVRRSCRRCRGDDAGAASSTARSTTSTPSARRAAAGAASAGVVVGGGLLGLEAAGALRQPRARHPRRRVRAPADAAAGRRGRRQALRRARSRGSGVDVHAGAGAGAVAPATTAGSTGVELADGTVARRRRRGLLRRRPAPRRAGPRPPASPVGERGGVVVDDGCRTDDPAVWAIGEVACVGGRVSASSRPGYAMAEVVADRLLGGDGDLPRRRHVHQAQAPRRRRRAASATRSPRTEGALELVYADPVGGVYKKLVRHRRRQDPARRHPGRRRLRLRARCARWSASGLPRPTTRRLILPGRRRPARRRELPDDARSAPATT